MTRVMVEAVLVGRPLSFSSEGVEHAWSSAIIKRPVAGTVVAGRLNLDGDQQADLVHHGGVDKAILAYPAAHYAYWGGEFPNARFEAGAFGENLSVSDVDEARVCVGDLYRLGTCMLQVSQPRQPCWKLSRRWQIDDLAVRVQQSRRTGWYLRVLEEGELSAGMEMRLVDRPYPELTIAWANDVMYARPRMADRDLQLAECPLLSESWRINLRRRAENA